MSIVLYGIPNCDTVRQARAWLAAQGASHHFHDFRKDGVPEAALDHWLGQFGWEALLNRRGTSWRGLADDERAAVRDAASARAALQAHPSLIRRPVVDWGSVRGLTVGFDAEQWREQLDVKL